MLKSFMFMQWKVSRWALAILVPVCLAAPILLLRFAERVSTGPYRIVAIDTLRAITIWLPAFPLLATVVGMTFALTAWNWDHNTNHIYALSLPIDRWRYALYKMISGFAVLAIPVAALLIGAIIATSTVKMPEGLHGYPISFGLRFMFAAAVSYALIFSMAAGTVKTTVRIVVGVILFFVLGSVATGWLSDALNTPIRSPIEYVVRALVEWPGPFNVFGGSWMLVDV